MQPRLIVPLLRSLALENKGAMYHPGRLYHGGQRTKRNSAEALKWYEKAAGHGNWTPSQWRVE